MTDWSTLEHAYGPADEVPDLLADIADGTEPEAGQAVGELFTLLYHQGSTYSATEAALPALVDLALTGPQAHRPSIVRFLGDLAQEDHTHPLIGTHVDRLQLLLEDPAASVREPAAWLLAQYAGRPLAERLAERYATETDPVVRASLLAAVGHADEERGAELAERAVADPAPEVRIAAALVLAEADVSLPDGAVEAVAAAYADGDPLDGEWSWDGDTVMRLLEHLDDPAMYAVLAASRSADVRRCVVYALEDAGGQPVAVLGPLLNDPDRSVRLGAVHAAQRAGRAAAAIADDIATAAAPLAAGDAPDLDAARAALELLIRIDDPRWRPLLLAAWRHGSTHDQTADVVRESGAAADPDLAAAARDRAAAIDAGQATGRVRFNRAASPSTERAALDRLLASWNPTAG